MRLLGADGRLTVEVWDVSPERPVLTDAAEEDEGGRGLVLVGALAARWGSDVGPGGKVVWADLRATSTRSVRIRTVGHSVEARECR